MSQSKVQVFTSDMFLRMAVEKILAEKDIRRKENLQLKKSCESAIEELKNETNGSVNGGILPSREKKVDAERYFLPFELACASRSPRIVNIALDCLQKLISYGHLSGNRSDKTNPDRKLNDRIVNTICGAFDKDHADETVLLQILKAILAVVLSPNCDVHEESLLNAVRVCFTIFLVAKSPIIQATARGILSQVINAVFSTMEAHGDEKDDATVVREVVEGLLFRVSSSSMEMNGKCASVDEYGGGGGASAYSTRGARSITGDSEQTILDDSYAFGNIYQKDAYLVFRALCILSQKGEGDGTDPKDTPLRSKVFALEMLLLVLQNSGVILQSSPPFIGLIKRSLCVTLSKNSMSNQLPVFEKSLAIFIELLDKFKAHLKLQIEVFFREMILSMLDSASCSFEHRLVLINAVSKVVSTPQALVDLYVNYDCDLTCHNVFANLVAVVSKTAGMPVTEIGPQKERDRAIRLLGLQCLVEIISCQVDWYNMNEWKAEEKDESKPVGEDPVLILEQQKQQKDLMEQGIFLFSKKSKQGLAFLQEHGFVGREAQEVAEFLLKEDRLDKTMVGDYLGDSDEFHKAVMYAYVDDMDFSSRDLLSSLRIFLEKFRLPGEAQKIDRLMEKFASRYCECNPSLGIFASADTAYVLAYSIIMLTTDLHSVQVRKKMTKEQYVNMNRGINNGGDLPREVLESIYDDISANEIKMKGGASKLLKSEVANTGSGQRRALATLELAAMSETARILMESISHSDANFVPASHQHHIRPMFKICWSPALAAFSQGLQHSTDADELKLCLRGFYLGSKLACLLDMERETFIKSLGSFTLLTKRSQMSEMKEKNIEAVKILLQIGEECGQGLKESWEEVLKCVSQLELASLIGTGFGSHGVEKQGTDRYSSAHYVSKNTGQDQKSLSSMQLTLGETASQAVVLAVDRIFEGSSRLMGEAIVDFVRALCKVSLQDLSKQSGPRMFMLQKIVEVASYNMGRIRLEWSRIWSVIGEHLTTAGCSSSEDISHFSVDAIRQLAIKFIEKGELPNYRFQKDFLRPFEVIMDHNRSAATRELVVTCTVHIVDAQGSRIKSGWMNLFSVWTIAAGDSHLDIIEAAFAAVNSTISTHFMKNFPSVLDAFQEALKCLTEFACNPNLPDMSMEAIRLIRQCAECVATNEQAIVEAPWEEKFSAAGEQRVWLRGWFPIFFELCCIINRCKLDVRTRSLTVLFEILKSHGQTLRLDWWRELFRVIFRIFEHAKQEDNRSDKKEWMVTTCNHAMYAVVDVYTQYFPVIGKELLPRIYEQFSFCIHQKNEQLARSTVNCLENIVLLNGDSFDEELWKATVTLICSIFKSTLPENLLTWKPEMGGFLPSAASMPEEEETKERGNPLNNNDTVREEAFNDAIVECIAQSEMVDAVASIVLGNQKGESKLGLMSRIEPALLVEICKSLAQSQNFARNFNANNGQRTLLWKAGLRGSSKPNLIRQETRSLSTLISILIRLLGDERAVSQRDEVLYLLASAMTDVFNSMSPSESASRRATFSPVVVTLLEECLRLPPVLLPLLGHSFPSQLCRLVLTVESIEMRSALAKLLHVFCFAEEHGSAKQKLFINGQAS